MADTPATEDHNVSPRALRWLIEVKADDAMNTEEVSGKHEAARRWSTLVSADPKVDVRGATCWPLRPAQPDAVA